MTIPSNSYPFGYKADGNGVQGMGTLLTIEQMETKSTVAKLHPEFWRRYKALMQYALPLGYFLGVGTGWRVQPSPPKPGFASPGNSNHEGFPADGISGGAVAIDTVCANAWPFMEKHLPLYGLRSFIIPSTTGYKGQNEPWHIQPIEIPASRNWRTAPWTLPVFQLPNAGSTPPKEVLATPSGSPSFKKGATDNSTIITPGAVGGRVTWLQTILRDEYTISLVPDGQFGGKTEASLKVMQTMLKVVVDGIYGNQTAAARYAKVGK
jgi:hypothetical protein